MTWFRVDDKLHDHRKVRAAGCEAMGLWVLAGSWCGDNLTDGFIPTDVVRRWTPKWRQHAQRLIAAGLWLEAVRDGETGYQFHQWTEQQPTREDVEERRRVRAAAGRAGGRASGAVRRSKTEASAEASASPTVEANAKQTRTPSRPDPYPSVLRTGRDAASGDDTRTPQTLVAEWIDHCGQRPPGKVVGQVSKLLEEMLTEGIPYPDVRAGLVAWQFKGLHPSALPSVVHETRTHTTHQSTTDTRIAQAQALKTQLRNHTALGIGTP